MDASVRLPQVQAMNRRAAEAQRNMVGPPMPIQVENDIDVVGDADDVGSADQQQVEQEEAAVTVEVEEHELVSEQ